MTAVFIYVKDGVVRALNCDEDIQTRKELIDNGWRHSATLDACKWIEHLCNNSLDVKDDVAELKMVGRWATFYH